jgi:streptomycin 3"-adenylyltransferase
VGKGPGPGEVAALVRDALGDAVVGAYLHGSAVLGGLRPGSDIDVVAVVRRTLVPLQRRALVGGLLEISGRRARRGPGRPVELTVVVQADVRPWRYPPRCDFQYGEWLRDRYERGVVPTPGTSPDLAVLLTMVRSRGLSLFGPAPAEVLDPVPPRDLVRAVVAGVPGLLADLEEDTRNVLLTLARVWTTAATGKVRSKDAAADWALLRLPVEHRPVLARAREGYLGEAWEDWAELMPDVHAHTAHVVAEIQRVTLAGSDGDRGAPERQSPSGPASLGG